MGTCNGKGLEILLDLKKIPRLGEAKKKLPA